MTYFSSPKLTQWQSQIITGTVIGGSCIVRPKNGRNCYLFMRSGNHNWLSYKAAELANFASQQPFTEEKGVLRWHSSCYPVFNKFHDMFYIDGKKHITMEILNPLRDIGLSIWFGDNGKIKNGRVWLNTHKFGLESTKVIVEFFNLCGIPAEIVQVRNKLRVVLTEKGTKSFLYTIAHRLPDFMHDKLKI